MGLHMGIFKTNDQNPSETDMDNKEEQNPSAVFVSFFFLCGMCWQYSLLSMPHRQTLMADIETPFMPSPRGWYVISYPAFKLHFSTFIPLFVG